MPESDSRLNVIRRGCVDLINSEELAQKLSTGRQLIIKAGFDPTAPDLHLGHTVLLRKLRHFQDFGHKVIFLVGDATALVGDPTGRSATRKLLTWDEVRVNAKTYLDQVTKILLSARQVFEVRYNSEWFLGRSPQNVSSRLETFDFAKWVQLSSRFTVARMIERDDFSKRLKSGQPLSMLELFYPLMQGYDSVKIAEQYGHCDVELGGSDQTFNLLVGRDLLREYGHEPEVVITMPLLEGTDGVNKMSKSLGNHIGISDAPGQMFGKLMSIPDTLIMKYFTLLTDVDEPALKRYEKQLAGREVNPRDLKAEMAEIVTATYHGSSAAAAAKAEFASVFSQKQVPTDMPTHAVRPDAEGRINVIELLVETKLAKSKNDARRLVEQRGVKFDGKAVEGPLVVLGGGSEVVLQVGSHRFIKLIRNPEA